MHRFTRRLFDSNISSLYSRKYSSFLDLNIDAILSKQLRNNGINAPTDIQKKAIPCLLSGKSAIINSETGSGKTLAYGIPIVEQILHRKKSNLKPIRPYAVVLVPNIELAIQVEHVFKSLHLSNVCMATEYSPLKVKNVDVVITTSTFLYTYPLDVLAEVNTIVVDEADVQIARKAGKHGNKDPLFNIIYYFLGREMLKSKSSSTSHKKLITADTIEPVLESDVVKNRQFVFVGATMPDNLNKKSKTAVPYVRSWLPDITLVQNNRAHKLVDSSCMQFIDVMEGNKLKLLVELLTDRARMDSKVLVFANRVDTVQTLYKSFTVDSYIDMPSNSEFLGTLSNFLNHWHGRIFHVHNKVALQERLESINQFASMRPALFLSTDVLSRGLDIPNIDTVIQYDFATNVIDGLHRAGRTARMNNRGEVINFITENDRNLANVFKEAINEGSSLEGYFSRNRSLNRRRKRTKSSCDNATE